MNKEQERLLTEAKLVMLRRMPYYGTYIIGTELVPDPNIPTAQTNMINIAFNPKWLLGGEDGKPLRSRDEVVFVLGHEVLHMSFKHGLRMSFRDPGLWNVACDFAINLILHEGEVGKMPENEPDPKTGKVPPKLLDPKYAGMSAETIYDLLEKERQKQGGGSKMKIGGVVIDLSGSDPGGMGGFTRPMNVDGSELTEGQKQDLERDIDAKTSSSAAAAKSQGKLPAGLERFIKTALKPIIDWKERLRMFVAKQQPSDPSWARPRRKFSWMEELYLPAETKQGVGKIAFVFDTSGSVGYDNPQSEGAQYFSECKSIFQDSTPEEMHLIFCDAEVAGHQVYVPGDDPEMSDVKPKGGGGTDFRPPFKFIEKKDIEIRYLVYCTDGWGSWPSSPPPYPVLWLITTDVVPPWGEHARLTR